MGERRTVIIDGEELEVDLEMDGPAWVATVEGETFRIEVPGAKAGGGGGGRTKRKRARSGTIASSMPGKVVTVEVAVGDTVSEGQVCLILEAMKMQNEMAAPISGTVAAINCQEGENVEANVPLVVVEPPADDGE